MKIVALPAAALVLLFPMPWERLHAPAWVERWLYNPRERTAGALEAYQGGDARKAAALADTAMRISGDEPLPRFNAGTAHLAAGDRKPALEMLEQAAKSPDPAIAAPAAYNLGNARLEARDAAGAVEAYKQALRLAPGHQNAKHNLEIALKEREKERLRLKKPQGGDKNDRPDGQEDSQDPSSGQGTESGPRPQPSPQGETGRSPEEPQTPQNQQSRPAPEGAQGSPGRGQNQPLQNFKDQPEMTAREAAAVLESVENLERQKRRAEAAERQQRRTSQERDW